METLGLSASATRTDGRLKSLFWPSIETHTDVDYLGAQGYWVCTFIAVISFVILVSRGQIGTATVVLLFFYLGGVGVRERSRYAAAAVLMMYLVDTLLTGPGVVRILLGALLLSNMRATWIASGWKPESAEAELPPRLSETLADKFADRLPMWLWPKVRIPYYIFSGGFLILMWVGLIAMALRRTT
jgi:hypothetical protein